MGISKGQVSWWQNHRDVGWRGCLKASWPASCSDKDYCQHSLLSATALSNWVLGVSWKEDSQHFCVTCVSATLPSWWKIFLHDIQPKLFKSQFTTIAPCYIYHICWGALGQPQPWGLGWAKAGQGCWPMGWGWDQAHWGNQHQTQPWDGWARLWGQGWAEARLEMAVSLRAGLFALAGGAGFPHSSSLSSRTSSALPRLALHYSS